MIHTRAYSKLTSLACALALSACNPLGSGVSSSDGFASPSSSTARTFNFTTATQSTYSFDSSQVQFASNGASLSTASNVDANNSSNGFGGGQNLNLTWVANGYDASGVAHSTNPYLKIDQNEPAINFELSSSWISFANLVAYLKLNSASGTSTADSSANANDGTLNNVSITPSGVFGNAAQFDGSTSYILLPSSVVQHSAYTYSAWFNTTNSGVILADANSPVTVTNTTPSSYNPVLYVGTDGLLHGGTYNNSSIPANFLVSSKLVNDGVWHHAVTTSDGSNQNLYLDGVLQETSPSGASVPSLNIFYVGLGFTSGWGASNSSWFYFNGKIDEVSLWSGALSSAQVSEMYQVQARKAGVLVSRIVDGFDSNQVWNSIGWSSTLPFSKALPNNQTSETAASYPFISANLMTGNVGLWHFDETNQSTAHDSSGATNDVALLGGPTITADGILGSSLNFAGNGYVNLSQAPILGNSPLTLSAWVKTSRTHSRQSIFAFGKDVGTSGKSIYLFINSSNQLEFDTANGAGPISNTTLTDGSWHHVAVTYDSTSAQLYVDGHADGNPLPLAIDIAAGFANIGYDPSGDGFIGQIDELAAWDRVLTPTEIQEVYRRASNQISFQVETCSDAACTSSSGWRGPDNTEGSFISEFLNTGVSAANVLFANFSGSGLALPTNRYARYKTVLSTLARYADCDYGNGAEVCSPELNSVSLGVNAFPSTDPSITSLTGYAYQTLSAFTETTGTGGCSSGLTYQLSNDGTHWYYWSGTAWVAASASNANSAVVINGAIPNFASQVGTGMLYLKTFLNSSGSSQCSVKSVQINF